MWLLYFVIYVIAHISCSSIDHRCPERKPAENFDINGIGRGFWYDVAKYPYPSPKPYKLLIYQSHMEGDLYVAKTINVNKSSPYHLEVLSKTLHDAPDQKAESAKLSFLLASPDTILINNAVMYVLAVDYNDFMIAYTCIYDEEKEQYREYAWVLSRTKPVPGIDKEKFIKIAENVGLDQDKLIWYDSADIIQ